MSRSRLGTFLVALAALGWLLFTLPLWADSQARIVRLSLVEGQLQIDRATGNGYENAFLNMPITEGTKLWAKSDARAEIEFEDGSTLRIVPDTRIEFTRLSLSDAGGRMSTVEVQQGTAYVNFSARKNDEFVVNFGHETTHLTSPAHFRVELDDTDATAAVFKGDISVNGPAGSVELGKKQTANFDFANKDQYTLAKNFEDDPFDTWDNEQAKYHDQHMPATNYTSPYAYGYSPYAYGMSDLSYYGNYFNAPGYGTVWQPYFVDASWDPFLNGAWMWYPGFGYTWVSSYPWGWAPYRYGSWNYAPGFGWVWAPGNSWNSWNTVPRVSNPPQRFAPPQPPPGSGHSTVVVNGGPGGQAVSPNRVVIRNGSAGLGVPRGSFRDLGKVSRQVESGGTVTKTLPGGSAVATKPAVSGSSSQRATPPARVSPSHTASPHITAPSGHSTPHSSSSGHSSPHR